MSSSNRSETPIAGYPPKASPRRFYPCVDCRKPESATRDGCRCQNCAAINEDRRREERRSEGKRAKKRATPPVIEPKPWHETDSAVQLYRQEKARKAERESDKARSTADAIESARQVLNADSEARGGNALRTDGSRRHEKYNRERRMA